MHENLTVVGSLLIAGALSLTPASAGTLFISNEKDNTVTVIDSETLKVVKTIPTGLRPRGMVLTPDFKG